MARLHKGMIRFALVRLGGVVATFVVIASILGALLGGEANPSGLLLGAFGLSAAGAVIAPLIAERLTVTLPLAILAVTVALAVGVPFGALAARGGLAARIVAAVADGALAFPAFFLGMLLVLVFTGVLRWLPQGGFVPWGQSFSAAFTSLLLPVIALAIPLSALIVHAAMRSFAGVASWPEVTAARLTGQTTREAAWRTGYPGAIMSIVALVGRSFGLVVAGAMVVENVFYLPGLGRLLFSAVAERDVTVVRGALLVLIAVAALVRMLADVGLVLADPRRIEEQVA